MRSGSRRHGRKHSELLVLYVLETLPSGEAEADQANLAACEECRQELRNFRPVVDSLVSWPTDVLRSAGSLWDRLAERIREETGQARVPRVDPNRAEPNWVEPAWKEVAPGIWCKLLATDADRDRVTMLVRLAPGTDYPAHRHAGIEELHLLDGELRIDDRVLSAGDYYRAEPGSVDGRVWSDTGCTCVLITSFHDVIL
jgi:anti-sigma factor ChrR (cupin superfamily)